MCQKYHDIVAATWQAGWGAMASLAEYEQYVNRLCGKLRHADRRAGGMEYDHGLRRATAATMQRHVPGSVPTLRCLLVHAIAPRPDRCLR